MNPALLAREAASQLGALDPRPEPPLMFQGPTRLHRVVDERGEIWYRPDNLQVDWFRIAETPDISAGGS